jgi:HD-GYP domain-containing protein (c-di-GMP phosphodiesterase class II)
MALRAMVNSVDAKDRYTCGHSERVAHISRALAQAAQLPPVDCDRVYLAGLLHDVGKIGVPDAILCKPGKLTTDEFDALKKHPEIGVRILSPVKQIRDLLPGVLYHHERMDGRGYPEGLAGEGIPRLGRMICLADCFDAMTTNRTYRSAMPLTLAIAEIRRCSGTQFDPALSELFLELDLESFMNRERPLSIGLPSIGQLGSLRRRA